MGVSPLTVIVSATPPTVRLPSICAVKFPESSTPSRLMTLKPGRVKDTAYVPDGRLTILYRPLPSETAVRTFSISAGLDTSTVTPGRAAPDESWTVPQWTPAHAPMRGQGPGTQPQDTRADYTHHGAALQCASRRGPNGGQGWP
jgi:hypothetical protein